MTFSLITEEHQHMNNEIIDFIFYLSHLKKRRVTKLPSSFLQYFFGNITDASFNLSLKYTLSNWLTVFFPRKRASIICISSISLPSTSKNTFVKLASLEPPLKQSNQILIHTTQNKASFLKFSLTTPREQARLISPSQSLYYNLFFKSFLVFKLASSFWLVYRISIFDYMKSKLVIWRPSN